MHSALLTDLYRLTMLQACFDRGMNQTATRTPFFGDEPVLRATAPMREAQMVESRIINLLHYETLIASEAARCVSAAGGKLLVDFGPRRAHAGEARAFTLARAGRALCG